METSSSYRPRVSRETRLLLTAGLLAVAALWLLARIRFPERTVTPNPVPSVLSQLGDVPNYDDLAAEVAQLQTRLQPSLLALDVPSAVVARHTSPRTAAIRLRDDLAVTMVPPESSVEQWRDTPIVARDPASGLAVVRVPMPASTSIPVPWTPRQPQRPRYLVVSAVSPAGVSLRPVFVGSLDAIESPLWSEPLWAVPEGTDLAAGSFVFTSDAELAGLVIGHGGALTIVPGATVLAEAERLVVMPPGPPGTIGIEVQDLTLPVASVTAAPAGVVVAWVDPDGASSERLMVGDVIETVDGRGLTTRQQWDVRVARLSESETLSLRVRRRGEVREVSLVANAAAAQPASRSLGLTLRARPKIGAEVVRIDRGSAADRAGLALGDVITLVAEVSAPTPAQVMRSYLSMGQGERVVVAVTRGEAHFVTTFER
jgi:S1-C subfamily serine protease